MMWGGWEWGYSGQYAESMELSSCVTLAYNRPLLIAALNGP